MSPELEQHKEETQFNHFSSVSPLIRTKNDIQVLLVYFLSTNTIVCFLSEQVQTWDLGAGVGVTTSAVNIIVRDEESPELE